MTDAPWLLLIHQVPAEPLYLRQRIRTLLARAGAVPLKRSVYALPAGEESLARLTAVADEVRASGGDAFVCEVRFTDARDAARVAESFAAQKRSAARGGAVPEWAGRVWVTRRGIHVDRIACAWFIRRFLDPKARFRFVATGDFTLRPGELGFDMPGGQFSHEDGGCSFETLLGKTGRGDEVLRRIAGIVHDIDLKDGKFGFPETAGVLQLMNGILAATPDDPGRLERGGALFDDLHRSLSRSPAPRITMPTPRPPGTRRRTAR